MAVETQVRMAEEIPAPVPGSDLISYADKQVLSGRPKSIERRVYPTVSSLGREAESSSTDLNTVSSDLPLGFSVQPCREDESLDYCGCPISPEIMIALSCGDGPVPRQPSGSTVARGAVPHTRRRRGVGWAGKTTGGGHVCVLGEPHHRWNPSLARSVDGRISRPVEREELPTGRRSRCAPIHHF